MRKILKIKSGSKLYGTDTPESDTDFLGIFVPTEEYFFGLKKIEELEESEKSIGDDGKNDKDAIDCKFYELRHYCRLAMQNNPNLIEMLFVNQENIMFIDEIGKELLEHNYLFPRKGAVDRFFGYAISQEKKMTLKVDNREALEEAKEFLEKQNPQSRVLDTKHSFRKRGNDHFQVGDMMIPMTCKVVQALNKYINNRLEVASWRSEMRDKYGYDTKFASHLIRLLSEGIELLGEGRIIFPLKDGDLIRSIKLGEYELDEVLEISSDLKKVLRKLEEKTNLPKKPRFDEIQNLLIGLCKKHLYLIS